MPQGHTPFKFIDLFAGLGGFHVALEKLGGTAVFAAEWDPKLNALYSQNFNLPVWSDVNDLDTDAVIKESIPDHDVLTAGFPCQPFSKAGDQLGFRDTVQGHLFYKVHDILRVKRPRRFILENVPNILEHDNGATRKIIIEKLNELNYNVQFERFSPHHFGVPQIRDRAYFIGSLDPLPEHAWPNKHAQATNIKSIVDVTATGTRKIPDGTQYAIDMWGDFLRRSPQNVKLPSFPIWAMEFGATYPFEGDTPAAIWARRPERGLSGMGLLGSFGEPLDGMTLPEQLEKIPSHSRRSGDFEFPRWKKTFIQQNREFYLDNIEWITPWLNEWRPWEVHSSFQKLEWNAQGEERNIDNFVLQIRASGIRVKRPTTAPTLVAFTHTQVPILGKNLAGERRYITPRECAYLQSLDGISLPASDYDAYKALGNAVNATVVEEIAAILLQGLATSNNTEPTPPAFPVNHIEPMGAIA